MKERLFELLEKAQEEKPQLPYLSPYTEEVIADYLLANGVIVPPVTVGQTVWVYSQTAKNIYKNTVICIKVEGASRHKNKISVKYTNQWGETSIRKFSWAQIGKQVFLTEQGAVDALAENMRKGATDERN